MYEDPIIKKYIDLIKDNTPVFKGIYQGDPVRVPVSNLPALLISKTETRVGPESNAEDEHGMALRLTVITDIRAELSTTENDAAIVEGIAQLYDICEGRDPATLELKPQSLLDILRSNILVDTSLGLRTDLGSITRIEYGETLRERAPEKWSVEARIELIAHFIQIR